jgi:hypothetical protein
MLFIGVSYGYPIFCPLAIMCPCVLAGRIESTLQNEKPIECSCCCCVDVHQLGPKGLCTCITTSLLTCCIPCPISPFFGCYEYCKRSVIMDQFSIEGGCMDRCLGCCYPCDLVQQIAFLEELKRRRLSEIFTGRRFSLKQNLLRGSVFSIRSDEVSK